MKLNAVVHTGLLSVAAMGCGAKPPAEPPAATFITGREWVLVALGERSSPVGAVGAPATVLVAAPWASTDSRPEALCAAKSSVAGMLPVPATTSASIVPASKSVNAISVARPTSSARP